MTWENTLSKGIGDRMGGLLASGQHNASPKTKQIRQEMKKTKKELNHAIDKALNNPHLEEFEQALTSMKQVISNLNSANSKTSSNAEQRGRERNLKPKDGFPFMN
jgi:septal ring factor EnvC (AmiA/AmiB activator)